MSGETEGQPSGWTIDTLFAHTNRMMAESDRRYEQRFEAQEQAVQAALLAAKEAVLKAELAAEKRFESVNEFRAQLSDQTATFMPRLEAEARIERNAERLDSAWQRSTEIGNIITSRLDRLEGRSTGISDGWGYIVGAIGLIGSVIAIVFALR